MKMPIFRQLTAAASFLLVACATPLPKPAEPAAAPVAAAPAVDNKARETLQILITLQERLDRVSAPLLVNNADLCKRQARKLLGFSAKNKHSFSAELADTAQSAFGFDERLRVTNVVAGSGAAQVGVRRGDILVAAEGQALPQGENAERNAATLLGPLVNKRTSVQLIVMRDGATVNLDVPLTLSCAFSIELGNADLVNAYADGRRIVVARGLVAFTHNDEELAYVIAREMSHNILGHAVKQKMSATMVGIIDNLIRVRPDLGTMTGTAGIKPWPAELDAVADRLSLYLIARAGYPIDSAPQFWRRLAEQHPITEVNGYTAIHPGTTLRLMALDKAIAEIRAKQAARRPLTP
ncbi:MAG: M48 family metalloprotease [Burkholderiales bacterium]|nr:M48 family metalloprotease [Burkholderiales bacterium]